MKILEYKNKNYSRFLPFLLFTHLTKGNRRQAVCLGPFFFKIHLVLDRKVFEESQSPQRFIYSRQTFLMLISRSFPPKKKKKKNVEGVHFGVVERPKNPRNHEGEKN